MTPPASHTPQIETNADQPALEFNNIKNSNDENLKAVAERDVSQDHPSLLEATRATLLTSEQRPAPDALAGIPVHVKENQTRMSTEPSAISSGTDTHLTALLERPVLQAVDKGLRMPAALGRITEARLDHP